MDITMPDAATALGRFRDGYFAEMLTVWVGLAVETHPEELRKALAQVFDLRAVRGECHRAAAQAEEARRQVIALRAELHQLHRDKEHLETQLDGLRVRIEELAMLAVG